MIKKHILVAVLLFLLGINPLQAISQSDLTPLPQHRISTMLIANFVDQYHYKQSDLNDEQSKRIFNEYLKTLDPNRNIFTKQDINQFSKYKTKFDDALIKGDLKPAFEMFGKFVLRRNERVDYAISRLGDSFDFSIKESYQFDRENADWPEDTNALDELWRQRVKNDYLTLMLAGKKDKELIETLTKRYTRIKTRLSQFNAEDAYELFVNAFLRNLEPHTAYFSPRTSENFNINMSLSLEGIGAVLQTVDEYTVVKRVIKGGPADLSKQVHAGDKIIGVGQGEKEVDDVIGWRLDDVVDRIRGPKDSIVQLHILPESSGPDGADKYVTITRNKIKLEDQKVKKSVLEIPDGKTNRKIGVIEIPTFYLDFAASARGDKDYSSTTRDTKKIIDELKAENVDGIVVDLRRNGGGSLVEAVSLTGLFIKTGPVVQIRNSNGKIQLYEDTDNDIAYSGPLAVLVDRHSASASEIFSGAIQDYGRGTIVGEPTFGKGTVQTIIDLNKYAKGSENKLGKLKITMAQFFRINGDSTQHRGVIPDIIFPTTVNNDKQGERSLENALPWAEIPATQYKPNRLLLSNLDNVRMKHKVRVESDSGFNFLLNQEKIRQKVSKQKEVSLVESKRTLEREQREQDRHQRLNEFRKSRGLEIVSLDEDDTSNADLESEKNTKLNDELNLITLRETASILVDVNHFSIGNRFSNIQKQSKTLNKL